MKSKRRAQRSISGALIKLVHPENVRASSIQFRQTLGLGGMAFLLFLLQAVTGMLLRFVYEPTATGAYDSILLIRQGVFFGAWIRNIHYWSGMLILVMAFLHLLRVFYTQAYYPPRRINWIAGLVLLLMVVMFNFTGYLLPWDQLSYWAVTVITNMVGYIPLVGEWLANSMRGGEEVGGPTLLIFYNLHTGVLPLIFSLLLVYHFWKVRRAGGVIVPRDGNNSFVPSMPNLLEREIAVGLSLLAMIFLFSIFADAPLLERADPAFSPNPVKAPWYFSGVQELLLHFHPGMAVFVIPLLVAAWMFSFPYLKPDKRDPGVWFYGKKGWKVVLHAAWISSVITTAGILLSHFVIDFTAILPSLPEIISNGLIPLLVWGLLFTSVTFWVKRTMKLGRSEMNLWIFTCIIMAYFVLMIVGIFFRGESMALTFYI